MFLLDTNVVSELRRERRADANVAAWAKSTESRLLFVSAVTVMEFERGILLAERKDASKAGILRIWFDSQFIRNFSDRILPIDTEIALHCAQLHVLDPKPHPDAFIAATALVRGMTVVTRNVRDFQPMGVPVFNPWESA